MKGKEEVGDCRDGPLFLTCEISWMFGFSLENRRREYEQGVSFTLVPRRKSTRIGFLSEFSARSNFPSGKPARSSFHALWFKGSVCRTVQSYGPPSPARWLTRDTVSSARSWISASSESSTHTGHENSRESTHILNVPPSLESSSMYYYLCDNEKEGHAQKKEGKRKREKRRKRKRKRNCALNRKKPFFKT
jgi:hypothetical protein